MITRENKKKLVIWLMVMLLINWTLLVCSWLKTVQHQSEWAIVYIIVFVIVNVFGYHVFNRVSRN